MLERNRQELHVKENKSRISPEPRERIYCCMVYSYVSGHHASPDYCLRPFGSCTCRVHWA